MKLVFKENELKALNPSTVEYLRDQLKIYLEFKEVSDKDLFKAWERYSKKIYGMRWCVPYPMNIQEFRSIIEFKSENGLERANKRVSFFRRFLSKIKLRHKHI